MFSKIAFTAVFILSSAKLFAEVDANIPRPGLYKWELQAETKNSDDTSVSSKSNSKNNTTMTYKTNNKVVTKTTNSDAPKNVCIKAGAGVGIPQGMKCTFTPPVKNGNSTTSSSVCSGLSAKITTTKLKEDTYLQESEIVMKDTAMAGGMPKAVIDNMVNSVAPEKRAEARKALEEQQAAAQAAAPKGAGKVLQTTHSKTILTRIGDCK